MKQRSIQFPVSLPLRDSTLHPIPSFPLFLSLPPTPSLIIRRLQLTRLPAENYEQNSNQPSFTVSRPLSTCPLRVCLHFPTFSNCFPLIVALTSRPRCGASETSTRSFAVCQSASRRRGTGNTSRPPRLGVRRWSHEAMRTLRMSSV